MVLATGRALLDPFLALKRAGLQTDMQYADLGAGMVGHFVFPAAGMIGPKGRAYGVDILKSVIESIQSKARMATMPNVIALWGDIERKGGVRIENSSLDFVSLVGLAELALKPHGAVDEARRILKSRGRFLVIDWSPGTGSLVVKDEDRIAPERVAEEVQQHGFRLIDSFEAGEQHWGLVFELVA